MATTRVVRLSRRAAGEVERARRWWLGNRDKAPSAFDEEFERILALLEAGADTTGTPARGLEGVRRVLLERIRYYVYFQIQPVHGAVEILAVWHASRGRPPRPRR